MAYLWTPAHRGMVNLDHIWRRTSAERFTCDMSGRPRRRDGVRRGHQRCGGPPNGLVRPSHGGGMPARHWIGWSIRVAATWCPNAPGMPPPKPPRWYSMYRRTGGGAY